MDIARNPNSETKENVDMRIQPTNVWKRKNKEQRVTYLGLRESYSRKKRRICQC